MEEHYYYSQQPTIHTIPFQHHDLYDAASHSACEQNNPSCCPPGSNGNYPSSHHDDSIDEYLSNSDDDHADDNHSSSDLCVTPPQHSAVCSPPTSSPYYHHHPHSQYIVIQSNSTLSSPLHTPHSPHFVHSPHISSPPQSVVHPYAPAYYLHAAAISPYNGNTSADLNEVAPKLPSVYPQTAALPQYHLFQQPSAIHQQHHFHQVVYPSSPLDYQTTPNTHSPPSTPSTPCHFLSNEQPSPLESGAAVVSPPSASASKSSKSPNKSKKRSRNAEKPAVPSSPIYIDNKLQQEINNFFTTTVSSSRGRKAEKPVAIPLLTSMSDTQKTLYRDLLKSNIPKISHNQNENEKISFLHGLYLMLMKCANHPYQFSGVEPPKNTAASDDHLIRCSGKLMVLEKILEAMQSSSVPPTRLFILSSSQPMLKILEDYFKLKSIVFTKPGLSADLEDDNIETQIILSTFLESSIYSPFKSDDLVVEFDHYWQLELQESAELSDSSLPSCGSANNHRSICPSFVLLAVDSVEEWAYQQHQKATPAAQSTATSKKDNMIEMMKFCIVKMAAASNASQSPVSKASASASTSAAAVASPVPSTPPGSELNTPIMASPSTSSSSLSSIGDAPGILSLYSQIHKDNHQDIWKTNSKTNTPFNFTFVSSEHNIVDPKSSDFQADKKRRNPKRQKNLCDRSCFLCKKEEDPKGRTSIVQCRSCPKIYHRSCAGLAHTPRSWKCPRHSCHNCRKTPNESGGSFFICKECPSSFCITCLPNDITILQKHEYSESKHDNEIPIHDSAEDAPTAANPNKKPKTPRPTVYIQCGKCTRKLANCLTNSSSSPSLLSGSTPAKITVCDSSNSSPELINSPKSASNKDPESPSLYLSEGDPASPQ